MDKKTTKVEAAFREMLTEGLVPTTPRLAQRAGVSKNTVIRAQRQGSWWTEEYARATMSRGRPAGSQYGVASAQRAEVAFREIISQGETPTLARIAKLAGISSGTAGNICRDASWWTPEHAKAARDIGLNTSRIALVEQSKHTVARVKTAFHEIVATGMVPVPKEMARLAGISQSQTGSILAEAAWWTPEHAQAAGAIGREIGTRNLLENRERAQASSLAKQRSLGFPNLAKARQRGRLANSMKRRGTKCSPTHGQVIKGALTEAKVLHCLEDAWVATGQSLTCCEIATLSGVYWRVVYRCLTRLRSDGLVDQHNRPTYLGELPPPPLPQNVGRILGFLHNWCSHHTEYVGNEVIARAVGINPGNVSRILRRLRADGLIDEHNRPITPSPASEGGTA